MNTARNKRLTPDSHDILGNGNSSVVVTCGGRHGGRFRRPDRRADARPHVLPPSRAAGRALCW
jgi:hypothetical protein